MSAWTLTTETCDRCSNELMHRDGEWRCPGCGKRVFE